MLEDPQPWAEPDTDLIDQVSTRLGMGQTAAAVDDHDHDVGSDDLTDDQVSAIVPGLSSIRDLEDRVADLTRRVAELEAAKGGKGVK